VALCYKKYPDTVKLKPMQDLLRFGLTEGQKDAESLGYIPLPPNVAEKAGVAIQNLSTQ
jgi:phosphate transport system substrate-binding protein